MQDFFVKGTKFVNMSAETKSTNMKKILLLPFLALFITFSCSSSDDSNTSTTLQAEQLSDVAYGNDPEQIMDIYLPEGRTDDTKVIVLIHGGYWVAGDKADMAPAIPVIQQNFPDYAIVNINYRLASWGSPAYPKQIEDIQAVLEHLQSSDYTIGNEYAFVGVSAGAHLSMLYAYKYDTEHEVKAVADIVGPADFTDPAYAEHPEYENAAVALLGTTTPTEEQIMEVNPVSHITSQSPPTISFYGGQDYLIPYSQGPLLEAALNGAGVYNEYNIYPDGGHFDWDLATMQDMYSKLIPFFQNHF